MGAANHAITFTPSEGTASGFTFAANIYSAVTVTGVNTNRVSFQLTGGSYQISNARIIVQYEPATSITTLPTANNKAYVISNARGTWNFADDATAMSASSILDLNATSQQVAIIYYDGTDDDTDNGAYYLYSVNAGKYLTASNTLTSRTTDAEQVSITATGNATYPWLFQFTDNSDGYINVDNSLNTYINNWNEVDAGNSNMIIEAADFDATDALAMFTTKTVTYNLSYGGNSTFRTVNDVEVTISGDASDFVPSSFEAAGVSLSYSPATITSETTEVTVTATWDGPFQFSESIAEAKYYTVGMRTGAEASNYIWKYDGTNIALEAVATNAYSSLSDAHCFAFLGNPYDGITIYNKAAANYVVKTDDDVAPTFGSTGTAFIPVASNVSGKTIASGYICFRVNGGTYYLNGWSDDNAVHGAADANGPNSTCWFIAPGRYHLAAMSEWNLDAPLGAVGTKSHITTQALLENIRTAQANIIADPFCVVGSFVMMNTILDPINNSSTITLSDGYYRFVNAYTAWTSTPPTTYYNSTTDRIEWSVASNSSSNVNSIFKVTTATPTIYSPNAQKYMSAINSTVSGALDNAAGTTVFTSLGSAQYNIIVNSGIMHTAGHSPDQSSGIYGTGTSGNLTSWGGGYTGSADAWYIVKVDEIDLTLNAGGDGNYYATMCLPMDVTLSGAEAYTLTLNGAKDRLGLSAAITSVPAGTPVLLIGTSASATASIAASATCGAPLATTSLTGVYTDTAVDGSTNYFLGKADDKVGFYHWEGSTLAANRAYLEGSTLSVKGFAFDFGNTTSIAGMLRDTNSDAAIYDLAGQRVARPVKGIYVSRGRKVVVR